MLTAIRLTMLGIAVMFLSSPLSPDAPLSPLDREVTSGSVSTPAVDRDPAIDWNTDHVDLRADAMRLRLGDTMLDAARADVKVHEWARNGNRIETRVRWNEAGGSHNLYFGFGPSGGQWRLSDVRYVQGAPGVRQEGAPQSPFEFAVPQPTSASVTDAQDRATFRVDALVPVYSCDGPSSPSTEVLLELDGVRLDVTPPEWTIFDDLRVLLGRGPQPRGDWLSHDGYDGPPSSVACSPPVAATLEDESIDLTRANDPTAVADLVTEEVSPGVLRVVSDGIRDLRSEPVVACRSFRERYEDGARDLFPTRHGFDDTSRGKVVAGLDGSIWLFWHDRFIRLGDETTHRWAGGQRPSLGDDIEVAPDGTVWHAPSSGSGSVQVTEDLEWAAERLDTLRRDTEAFAERPDCLTDDGWLTEGDGALRAYRDGEWQVALHVPSGPVWQVEISPDDSIWVAWRERTLRPNVGPLVARLGADGWRLLGLPGERVGATGALELAQDGTVFLQTSRGEPTSLWRLADGADPILGDWRPLDVGRNFHDLVMSPDGVIWGSTSPNSIARLDEAGWRVWDLADSTEPDAPRFIGGGGPLASGHDGSLWLKARQSEAARWCHGIYNFDGTEWSQFLDGHCIHSIDVAPNGWVWLRAGADLAGQGEGPVDLYVIRPEAVEFQRASQSLTD